VSETPEKEPQAETLNKETQLDQQSIAPIKRSSRMPAIVVSLALALIGAAATYALPNFNIALPNFSSFAELFPRETASAPIPDPAISAALKDIQSVQEQQVATLQENGAVQQQNTAMLEQDVVALQSLKQGFTSQQTTLKTISNQLSSLIARVDSLQNAVMPPTTSSIPGPRARARLVGASRKKTSRPAKPVGPVSVGGAPLSSAPASGWGAG
jgi:uncharacterized coiled-coil protein SlyX